MRQLPDDLRPGGAEQAGLPLGVRVGDDVADGALETKLNDKLMSEK